jgi:hypothetical protein
MQTVPVPFPRPKPVQAPQLVISELKFVHLPPQQVGLGAVH